MKILIAYDGSACADAALEDLRQAGLPPENDVMVVAVAHAGWSSGGDPMPASMKETEGVAKRACARLRLQFPDWNVSSEALCGETANMLYQTILRCRPELVVVGSHGRTAAGRLLLGSVSLEVAQHAPCSVRVVRVRARKASDPMRLLVATDGSLQALAVVEAVARRSWPEGTLARVVSVAEALRPAVPVLAHALKAATYASDAAFHAARVTDARERAWLKSVADESADWLEVRGLGVSTAVFEGDPRNEVVAAAHRWNADMVFVGARGLGALDRLLLGTVSTAILTHAHCTVEVVRPS